MRTPSESDPRTRTGKVLYAVMNVAFLAFLFGGLTALNAAFWLSLADQAPGVEPQGWVALGAGFVLVEALILMIFYQFHHDYLAPPRHRGPSF